MFMHPVDTVGFYVSERYCLDCRDSPKKVHTDDSPGSWYHWKRFKKHRRISYRSVHLRTWTDARLRGANG